MMEYKRTQRYTERMLKRVTNKRWEFDLYAG